LTRLGVRGKTNHGVETPHLRVSDADYLPL
jgi:hypothetical protein